MPEEEPKEEDPKYRRINDIFMSQKVRNKLKDDNKNQNQHKSSTVRYVEDKIRFTKSGKGRSRSNAIKKF